MEWSLPKKPEMEKQKILVIGFQPYNEKMYPPLYDFLQEMEQAFTIRYLDHDRRGEDLVALEASLSIRSRDLRQYSGLFKSWHTIPRQMRRIFWRRHAVKQAITDDVAAIIAIDHTALANAARYAKDSTTLIFWSLDFISSDRNWSNYYLIRRLLRQNIRDIRKCRLIIVQDPARGAVLDSILFSHAIPKFYMPTALRDDDEARTIAYGKAQQAQLTSIRLMQLNFSEERGSDSLLQAYQFLGDNITLSFQGNSSSQFDTLIGRYARKPEIFPFQAQRKNMRSHLAKSDIGFIGYRRRDLNHFFISKASGQLVEFLRFGIPIIVFESLELGQFVRCQRIGVYIERIQELSEAIQYLTHHYAEYSTNARNIYESTYQLTPYCNALQQILAQDIPHQKAAKSTAILQYLTADFYSGTAPGMTQHISPLTKSTRVVIEKEIETAYLIKKYYEDFFIDVSAYFHGYQTIQLCRCQDTSYRFYYPFDIMGDSRFYEHFERFEWYYRPWNWEQEQASAYIQPGMRVLEIGCGKGAFLQNIQQRGGVCTGLELNRHAIQSASQHGIDIRPEMIYEHAHHYREYYDIVCSFQVLEHICDVYPFLDAQIRCLKKGGKLIIAVPNNDAFFKYDQDNVLTNMPPHHTGLWEARSLQSLADIFPVTLEKILYEPLQHYNFSWFQQILVKQYTRTTLQKWFYTHLKLNSMLTKMLPLVAPFIRGHTIMAIFTK